MQGYESYLQYLFLIKCVRSSSRWRRNNALTDKNLCATLQRRDQTFEDSDRVNVRPVMEDVPENVDVCCSRLRREEVVNLEFDPPFKVGMGCNGLTPLI